MAIHLTKIYTKGGDKGLTSLVGGQRVSKSSLRLESYGTVDELNSIIGILRTELSKPSGEWQITSRSWLEKIQHELFDLGSVLATAASDSFAGMADFEDPRRETRLESEIDLMLVDLPALNSFVLPGGSPLNATAHLARTVCRRAERLVCALEEHEPARPGTLRYLNRLSDWLFVFSRYVSSQEGVAEYLWQHNQ